MATYDAEGNASATLTNGTVNVGTDGLTTTDGKELELSDGDDNGVQVTAANGTVQNIFGLSEGATVTYDGKTYEHIAGKIIVSDIDAGTTDAIYEITDTTGAETDLLNLGGDGIAYVQIVDDAIAISSDNRPPVYYGTDPTYSEATYFAKLTSATSEGEDGATVTTYTFTRNTSEESEDIDGLTIDANAIGDSAVVVARFAAEITTMASASITVNDVAYTNVGDGALVVASTADGATLTEGTVDITESLDITGGQTVEVSGADGVTVEVTRRRQQLSYVHYRYERRRDRRI